MVYFLCDYYFNYSGGSSMIKTINKHYDGMITFGYNADGLETAERLLKNEENAIVIITAYNCRGLLFIKLKGEVREATEEEIQLYNDDKLLNLLEEKIER